MPAITLKRYIFVKPPVPHGERDNTIPKAKMNITFETYTTISHMLVHIFNASLATGLQCTVGELITLICANLMPTMMSTDN